MARADAGNERPSFDSEAIAHQESIFRDTFPGVIGVRILEAEAGRAVGVMDVGPAVRHPGGYAHGGALAGFGDTVAAWATFPALNPGEGFSTIEFKANFVAGIAEGRLRAEALMAHRGKRTFVFEVRITTDDAERRLVAIMIVTQAILSTPGNQAGEVSPDE